MTGTCGSYACLSLVAEKTKRECRSAVEAMTNTLLVSRPGPPLARWRASLAAGAGAVSSPDDRSRYSRKMPFIQGACRDAADGHAKAAGDTVGQAGTKVRIKHPGA
jgi:hypothetical protein